MTEFVPIVLRSKPLCGGEIPKAVVTSAMRVAFINVTIVAQQDLSKGLKILEWYVNFVHNALKYKKCSFALKAQSFYDFFSNGAAFKGPALRTKIREKKINFSI